MRRVVSPSPVASSAHARSGVGAFSAHAAAKRKQNLVLRVLPGERRAQPAHAAVHLREGILHERAEHVPRRLRVQRLREIQKTLLDPRAYLSRADAAGWTQ